MFTILVDGHVIRWFSFHQYVENMYRFPRLTTRSDHCEEEIYMYCVGMIVRCLSSDKFLSLARLLLAVLGLTFFSFEGGISSNPWIVTPNSFKKHEVYDQ